MKIEPSGVIMIGECDIQTPSCSAKSPSTITAVWTSPGRSQVNVCRKCLEEMVRAGEWEVPEARLSRHIDVAITGASSELILAIEVKRVPFHDRKLRERAKSIHRNLVMHSAIPGRPFFMLIFVPNKMFLWLPSSYSNAEIEPDFEVDIETILAPYLASQDEATLDERSVQEEIVARWFAELVDSPPQDEENLSWLYQSELISKLKGATVHKEMKI